MGDEQIHYYKSFGSAKIAASKFETLAAFFRSFKIVSLNLKLLPENTVVSLVRASLYLLQKQSLFFVVFL